MRIVVVSDTPHITTHSSGVDGELGCGDSLPPGSRHS